MEKLILTGATVQGVRGLSQLNKKLLKQHGAEDPVLCFLLLGLSFAAVMVLLIVRESAEV
jgi:hypothetical protein